MNEADRRARNTAKLAECHPAFRARLAQVLSAMSGHYRPRVQEAYRSPADQQKAFDSGHSKLRYGLHNATGPGGRKEALAADVLDDDHPTSPPRRYLLALAVAAADAGLETGILWGLNATGRAATRAAIRRRDVDADVPVGWDPTHVQTAGLTAAAVKAGARPTPPPAPPAQPTVPDPAPPPQAVEEDLLMEPRVIKVKDNPQQYLVVPGHRPVPIIGKGTPAELRVLWPGLDVKYVDVAQTTLDTLNGWT